MRSLTKLYLSFLLLISFGCATKPTQTSPQPTVDAVSSVDMPHLVEVDSFRVSDPEPPKVVDEELDTIPVEVNPMVDKWVNYFQGKGRHYMERYLSRSTRYSKLMKRILRENGLPEDLIYVALIESGFSSKATSRAAAVGYWQFIKGTGRRYGLEVNSLVDERRDPVLATQAAAEYFKGLYSVFGSWYLAMAAYNVGENRIKKEVTKQTTHDFWVLAHKKRLPKETINYVPKFIAAKLICNDPAKYGFAGVEYETPVEFEHIIVKKPVNLKQMALAMNFDYDDLKEINPKFKGEVAPLKGDVLELRIPIGQQALAMTAADKSAVEKVEYIADLGETQNYRVRSGDSLYTIARKYHTTVVWLKEMNELKNGKKLRIGQRLQVPERGVKKSKPTMVVQVKKQKKQVAVTEQSETTDDVEAANTDSEVITPTGTYYIVQKGDTLSGIADEYGSSVEELRRMNRVRRGAILKIGMKLKVPKEESLPTEPGASNVNNPKSQKIKLAKAALAEKRAVASINKKPKTVGKIVHVVKRGENLKDIADKYGVTIASIKNKNRIHNGSKILAGAKLFIPSANAAD